MHIPKFHLFAPALASGAMRGEMILDMAIANVHIRHNPSFPRNVRNNYWHERFGFRIVNYHRASLSAITVHQRKDLYLVVERQRPLISST